MKNIAKKLFIIAAIIIMMCIISVVASAKTYGVLTYKSYGNKIVITDCENSATEVEIPVKIDGVPVTAISDFVFFGCTQLEKISIADSVTSISSYSGIEITAYYKNEDNWIDGVLYAGNHLIAVDKSKINGRVILKDGTKTLIDRAFSDCNGLESIVIPEGVTTIPSECFYRCEFLQTIIIPESVTVCERNSFYCLNDSNGNKRAIYYYGTENQWKEIERNTTGLAFAQVFYNVDEDYCLVDEVLFNKNGTMLIDFRLGENLYVIPDSIKSIEQKAFKEASRLHTVILPEGLKNIGASAFNGASNLTNIYIPASVSTIDTYTFYGTNLTDVYFGGTQEQWNAITIGNNNTNLKNANVHYNSELVIEDGVVYNSDKTVLICYDKTDKIFTVPATVKTIGARAFNDDKNLQQIVLPSGLEEIAYGAFYNCTSLSEIVIPGSVTIIEDSAFYGCSDLYKIELGEGITTINNSVFKNCTALTDIVFSDSLEVISSNAFYGCTAIGNLKLPEKLKIIGDGAFDGCTALATLTFPESLTSIGASVFANCTALTYISLPDSISSMGSAVFKNCLNLEKICLSEGNLAKIPANAFNGCGKLTDIYISSNITEFGDSVFLGCNQLSYIYFGGTETQWDNISIVSSNSVIWAANVQFNHKHSFDEWTVDIPAQQCIDGYESSICTVCNYKERRIIPCTHNMVQIDAQIPTCAEIGWNDYEMCKDCDYTTYIVIPATGNHDYISVITTPATCKQAGVRTYTCTVCSDSYTEPVEIDSTNHVGGTEIRSAYAEDCGNNGYTGDIYCLGCDTKLADGTSIPATGNHDYTSAITTPATCNQAGVRTYTCTVCSDSYTEPVEIDSTNHVGGTEIRGAITEDCGNNGYTGDTYCLGCNVKIANGSVIPATDNHSYTSKITTPATCNQAGVRTYTCTVCDDTYTEPVEINSANHTGGTVVRNAIAEDCGNNGYTGDTYCLGCNAKIANGSEIPATGNHSYTSKITTPATCKTTGVRTYTCTVCEDTYTDTIEIDTTNHTGGTKIRFAYTEDCGNNGYTGDTYCLGCNAKIANGSVIPATGRHNYISSVITPATCNSTGLRTYTCTVCEDTYTDTIEIDTTNHTGGTEIRGAYAEDCGNNGYTGDTYCLGCNAKITNGSVIPATGKHNHSSSITLPATCKTTGVRTYICTVCEDTYTETIAIDTTNHSGGTENRGAITEDCGNNGYTGDTYCLGCNEKIANGSAIPATGNHDYTSEVTTPATCITTGVRTYTCNVCEDTYTETINIDSSNHIGGTELRNVISADCKNNGYTGDTYCLGCNTKISTGTVINATGNHNHTSEITTAATCETTGVKTYTCTVCDDTYTETIEIDTTNHTGGTEIRGAYAEDCGNNGYTGDTYCLGCNAKIANGSVIPATGRHNPTSLVTTPATCKTTGVRTYTCTVCGDSYEEDIPVNANNHAGGTEVRNKKEATCTADGYSGDVYCTGCNKLVSEGKTINMLGHTEIVLTGKSVTCTETGITEGKKCSACGEILVAQKELPATGHTAGEWEVVVPAQVGIEGKEQQKCTVCGTVVNEREIPALEPQYILGDANGDGKITAADARITLRISAKLDKIEDFNLPLAALDVTGDEKLTAADARKILRISAKLE